MPLNNIVNASLKYPEFVSKKIKDYYMERVIKTWSSGHIMRGREPQVGDIILTSNDYLSIGSDRRIKLAQANAIMHEAHENMVSAVFVNNDSMQSTVEDKFASLTRSEATIITQSGWSANTGLLQTVADENTPVYIDFFAHTSLWEGIKTANAKAIPFRHNDPRSLEKLVRRNGQGIVIVDSVYSTDGDICPLNEIISIAEENECIIIVDESHSLGTHGPEGSGLVVEYGLEKRVHFRTASLAKAFASRAGLVTCSSEFKDYFIYTADQSIFSSTLLKHEYYALNETINVIQEASHLRKRLHHNARVIRESLDRLGYNVDISKSQIISLESGTEQNTIILRDALESKGVFGSVFCAPATPKNRAKIRFSINAALTSEQLSKFIHVCDVIRDEVNMSDWPSTRRKVQHNHAISA